MIEIPEDQVPADVLSALSAVAPPESDPVAEMDALGLSELTDQKIFDPIEYARERGVANISPEHLDKLAEANALTRAKGFQFKDLPSVKQAGGTIFDMVKGGTRYAKNLASALTMPFVDIASGGQYTTELADIQTKQAGEILGATELAVSGLGNLAERGVSKVGKKIGISTPWDKMNPGEKRQAFFDELGRAEELDKISKGQGTLVQSALGETLKDKDIELDQEAIHALSAGDPLSFVAFGQGFNLIGKGGKVLGKVANLEKAAKVAEALAKQAATKTVGGALKVAGGLAEFGGKAAKSVSGFATPAGAITGLLTAGPIGVLPGIAGGEVTKGILRRTATAGQRVGGKLSRAGEQISGGAAVTSPYTQLAIDLLEAAPASAGKFAEGAGIDLGLAAATSETPTETEGMAPIGVAVGLAKGGLHAIKRGVSGQYLAPREWGSSVQSAPYGDFAALDTAHQAAIKTADPRQVQRVNAIRELLRGAKKGIQEGVQAYLSPDAATTARFLRDDYARRTGQPAESIPLESFMDAAQQKGMYSSDFQADDGSPRRVVLLNSPDVAPHEAFHGFQDVLGESGNRMVDQIVYNEYAPQWESIGADYARRLSGGDLKGKPWRDVIQERTNWENPDIYLARELAAENFDAAFKGIGSEPAFKNRLPQRLAKVVGNFLNLIGIEPFEGRKTEGLAIEPKFGLAEKVREVVTELSPKEAVTPKGVRPPAKVTPKAERIETPISDTERQASADAVTKIADEKIAARDPQTAEVLRKISSAIATGQGVRVDYRSAPGEPAGSPGISRSERRSVIETFRDMPEAVRPLWEKLHFPDKVEATKGKGLQLVGWSPENFAANAQKVSRFLLNLSERNPDALKWSPYELDRATGSFSTEGWTKLYEDVKTFVHNQQMGGRGSGEPLILPKNAAQLQVRVPAPRETQLIPLDQNRADFINTLFNVMLPETARVSRKGGTPGNIVAQEIAAANAPERIVEPGRPRGIDKTTGLPKEFTGFPGRTIKEVNPLRAQMEQNAQQTGIPFPELIEVNQRLNLEHIADVNATPEAPAVRGVTDTLRAGFFPPESPKEWVVDGRRRGSKDRIEVKAVDMAEARRLAEGQGFTVDKINTKTSEGPLSFMPEQLKGKNAEEISKEVGEMNTGVWRKTTTEFQGDKFGGGLTGLASEIGASIQNVTDLTTYAKALEKIKGQVAEARSRKDFDAMMKLATKAQFFRELLETATDGTTADYIRREKIPDFQAPFPKYQFTPRTEAGKALVEKGYEVEGHGKPGYRRVVVKRRDNQVGEISAHKTPDDPANTARIANVYLTTDLRGEGIGEALYREILDQLREDGVTTVKGYVVSQAPLAIREKLFGKGSTKFNDEMSIEQAQENLTPGNNSFVEATNRITPDLQFSPEMDVAREKETNWGKYGKLYTLDSEADPTAKFYFDRSGGKTAVKAATDYLNKGATQERVDSAPQEIAGAVRALQNTWDIENYPKFKGKTGTPIEKSAEARGVDAYKLRGVSDTSNLASKMWILPNGEPVALGAEWHHDWLNKNAKEMSERFGLSEEDARKSDLAGAREAALKKGFARINYQKGNGTLSVEARSRDWPKVKKSVGKIVEQNVDNLDRVNVTLFDDLAASIVESDSTAMFDMEPTEKLANIPFITKGDAKPAPEGPVRPLSRVQAFRFIPETGALPGMDVGREYRREAIKAMSRKELREHFPEAIVPPKGETIPSEIIGSPLYKEAGSPGKAIKAFSDKLVDFAKKNQEDPIFIAGLTWYDEFTPMLKKEFGEDAPIFAELLAATSPQTAVATNFAYAMDAIQSLQGGRFDKILPKFEEGLAKIADGSWEAWYNKELKAGRLVNPPKNPTAPAFLAHWIDKFNLKPTQSNGKLYGTHSLPVLKVFTRRWLDQTAAPKTQNFVKNLLGTGDEATIDLWADRTMRRLGYEGFKDRWRILPGNNQGVSDADFSFAQDVFRKAAEDLEIRASALQGGIWFAEKKHWADNGWGNLDLGDFKKEMERSPIHRAKYRQQMAEKTVPKTLQFIPEAVEETGEKSHGIARALEGEQFSTRKDLGTNLISNLKLDIERR